VNGGSPSGIGSSSSAAGNLLIDGGTLKYTGSATGVSIDRLFTVGANGATLDSSGTGGTLTFSATGDLATITGTSPTLTLAGITSIAFKPKWTDPSGGVASLIKDGSNTVTVSALNTYSGSTTISNGTLQAGSATSFGTGDIAVASGAALDLYGQTMTSTGRLTINGAGVSTNGALTNSSGTAATYAGLLNLGSASSIGHTTVGIGAITLSNVGTIAGQFDLTLGGATGGTINSVIGTGAGGIIKNGSSTWTLSGANTYDGATTINAGTLNITNATGLGSTVGATTISSSATLKLGNISVGNENLTINGGELYSSGSTSSLSGNILLGANSTFNGASGNLTLSGNISSGGSAYGFSKAGVGTLVLSGDNTFSGVVSFSAASGSTLRLGSATALGNASKVSISAMNVTLDVAGWETSRPIEFTNSGYLTSSTGTGGLVSGDITTSSTTNSNIQAGSGAVLTISGVIKGSGTGTVVYGSNAYSAPYGVILLSGSSPNTYSNASTIGASSSYPVTVKVGKSNPFGAGNITITSGSVLDLNGQALTSAGTLTLNGTGISSGGALINSSSAASFDGQLILGSAASIVGGSGAIEISNTITSITGSGNSLTLGGTVGGSIASVIGTGSGPVTKQGSGTWTLSGANTYTGATTVSAGTLAITNASGLGTTAAGTTIASGATLDLQGVAVGAESITINGGTLATSTGTSSLSGAISLGASGSTFSVAGTQLTLSGIISGGNGFTKTGSGTLILSGGNTYTGATTVSAGTLAITNASGLGTTAAGTTIASGATLDLQGVAVGAESITINGGTLATSTGTSSLSGAISLGASGSTFSVAGTQLTLSGIISGGNGFTKTGSGTLTLSNANTYTGTTTISAGTLKAGNAAALGPSTGAGAVSITSGAVLDLNGQSLTNSGALTINGTGITLGGALINSSSAAASYSGLIALGAASSIVGDAGTIALTNAGTITGATFALTLGGAQGGSIASIIGTTTGTVTKEGAGTWSLAGANTYTGTTTINAGTLSASSLANGGTASGIGQSTSDAANLVINGGTLKYTGSQITINRLFTIGANGATLDNSSGGLTFGNSGSLVVLGTSPTLTLTASTLYSASLNSVLPNPSGGTLSIVKNGAGTGVWALNGSNTFTGTAIISSGTLTPGLLALNNASLVRVDAGAILKLPEETTTLSPFSKAITLNGGILSGGTTGGKLYVIDAPITLTADSRILMTGGFGLTLLSNAVISGAYSVAFNGVLGSVTYSSPININSANTYTGTTTINFGTITINNANAFGNASSPILLGATSGTVLARLYATGNITFSRDITVQAGSSGAATVGAAGSNSAVIFSGNIAMNKKVTLSGENSTGNAVNFTGVISGNYGVDVSGGSSAGGSVTNGIVTLSNTNTYTGATIITNGGLKLGSNYAVNGSSGVTVNGGNVFDLGGYSLSKPVNLAAGAFLTNTNSTSISELSGGIVLNTAANISASSNATLLITTNPITQTNSVISSLTIGGGGRGGTVSVGVGGNTYTGGTSINITATLKIASDDALAGTGNITILTYGKLDVAGNTVSNVLVVNSTSGTNSLIYSSQGSGGTLTGGIVLPAINTGALALAASTGATLTINTTEITGVSSLTIGSDSYLGTVVLAGNSVTKSTTSYTGATNVISGATLGLKFDGTPSFNSTYTGTGSIIIEPLTSGGTVSLGSTGSTLNLPVSLFNGVGGTRKFADGFTNITIGSGGAGNVSVTGAATFSDSVALVSSANVTINSGASVSVSQASGNLVVAATGNFINNAGSNALVTTDSGSADRWIVYSASPVGNTFGGLVSGNKAYWGTTYSSYPPASVESGKRYVFSNSPTITTTNAQKIYGDTIDISTNYSLSGTYQTSASTYGNVYLDVTSSDIFATLPTISSAGEGSGASVGGYAITASGAAANAGYGFTYASTGNGTLTVNPRLITVTGTLTGSIAKEYDGTDTATLTSANYSLSGFSAGQGATVTKTSGTYNNANAGSSKLVTVSLVSSDYLADSGTDLNNYSLPTSISGSIGEITKANAYVMIGSGQSSTYGSTPTINYTYYSTATGTGGSSISTPAGLSGTATITNAPSSTSNAATYSLTYASGLSSTNYEFNPAASTVNYVVNPAILNLTISKTYNGDANFSNANTYSISGTRYNSDSAPTITSGAATTSSSIAGTYTSFSSSSLALSNTNYTLVGGTISATINQKALTITASNDSKTYGDVKSYGSGSTAFTSSGLVNSETISSVTITDTNNGRLATAAAGGTYALTPSLATGGTFSASNYNITYTAGALTVNKATLTVTADNKARVYGDNNPTLTYSITGYVNSENATSASITGAPTISTTATAASNVNSYTITSVANNLAAANYQFSYADGTLTVNRRPVTVTADNQTRVYGEANPTLTYAVAADGTGTSRGMYNNQTLTGSVTTAAVATMNVGDVSITQNSLTNANNANYDITYNNGTLTITPAVLTYNATAATSTYGSTPSVNAGSVTGWKNSETASTATTGTLLFSTTATGTSTVGTYAINGSGLTANNGNYTFTQATGNANALTINQKALTITSDAQSTTYGTALVLGTSAYTSSGLVNSDSITSVTLKQGTRATVPATQSAGTYSGSTDGILASAAQGTGLSNYSITYAPGTLTINQKALTITANNDSKTYGDVKTYGSGSTAFTLSGLVNSETIGSVTITDTNNGRLATAAAGGTYALTPSLATGGTFNTSNYNITYTAGTLTVNQKALTITASNDSKTYGDVKSYGSGSTAFTSSGLVNSETISSVTITDTNNGRLATAAAGGTYALTPSLATGGTFSASNYNITYTAGALTVNKATLTVTADNKARVYGDNNPTLTYSITGYVNSENATSASITGAPTISTTATAASNVNSYTITSVANNLAAANYQFSYADGTLTVNRRPVTVTADNQTRVYGEANPTLTYAVAADGTGTSRGMYNNQTLTGSVTTAAVATMNVGDVSITQNSLTNANNANYDITYNNGTLTITPAVLTYNATAATSTYGSTPSVNAGSVTGWKNSETASTATTGTLLFSTTATGTSTVGTYAINGSGLTANNGNYTFTQATGNANALTINQKALTITSDAQSTTYGTALVLGTSAYTSSGLVNSDSITSVTLKQGTRATVPATQSAGTYSGSTDGILASAAQGTGLSNYSITYAPGTLTINQKALTITANNDSKTYGDVKTYGSGSTAFTLSGLVNSETIGSVTITDTNNGRLATAAAGGTYALTPSLATGGTFNTSNYNITYTPGTLTINKLPITLSGNVTYTGSSIVNGLGLTITNLVSGDTSNISGSLAIASADVGSQSVVNFGGLSLSNSNYTVTGASGSVNVTPAPLGISATGVYTGTTTILPTNYVLTGLVGSDVNATLVSFVVNNKNVASATRVTGMTLGGALASNYEINSSANSTPSTTTTNTVSLTRAALTITAVNDAKFVTQTDTQGSSSNCNPSPCVGGYAGLLVNGLLAGETITVLSSSPTITRTNASVNSHGEYLGVLMPTGFSSSNYNLSYVAGNYTIVPADTLLVKVAAVTATYGSSPNYSGKVTAQYLRSGNILVDLTPGISNSDISVDDGAGTTANFTLRGLGVTTSSSGKANVGQFNIEASNTIVNGTNFSNNLVVTGSLKINPLTLTANNLVSGVSKTYDGNDRVTNIPLNISGSGVLTNDVIGVTGLGRFSATSNVGSSLAVNIDLSLTGADKGNYALDTSTLNANIGQINQLNSVTYVGQTGGSWSDAANWAGGAIPTLSNVANVVIPSGVSVKYDHVSLGANAPASGVLFENNGVLVINESSNYTLSNNISGAGSVTQSGTGLLTMSGNNTFTGGINITNKSIILGSANALGAGSVTSSGGTLGVSSGVTLPRLTVNGPVTLSSDITTSGSQIYNGTVSLGRTLTLDAGVNNVTFNDSVGHVGISYANYVAQHGSNNVYNLTVLADTVNINADITTYGTQTYGRDNALTKVVIGGVGSPCLLGGVGNCRILISEDPAITVWGTVNDSVVNTHDLVLKSVAYSPNENPTVDLKGNVGDLKSLKSLTVSTGMQESAGSPQFADISQSQYRGNITLLGDVTTLNNQEYTANQITVGANSLAEEYTFTSTEGRVIFNTGASNVPPTIATGSSYRIADTYTSNLSNQSTGGGGISSALILSEIHRFGLAANDVSIDQRKIGNGGSSMEITCVSYDDLGNCKFDE
jgi:autotransporter-associated beta strand protein